MREGRRVEVEDGGWNHVRSAGLVTGRRYRRGGVKYAGCARGGLGEAGWGAGERQSQVLVPVMQLRRIFRISADKARRSITIYV